MAVTERQRIRAMTTADIERELAVVHVFLQKTCGADSIVVDELHELAWHGQPSVRRDARRALRLRRELLRRDYADRPHGRSCACSDACEPLRREWVRHWRRPTP